MSISYSDEVGGEDAGAVLSTSYLTEDINESSLRPQSLSEYIGQEKVMTLI